MEQVPKNKENKNEVKEFPVSVKVYKLEGKKPAGTDTPWYLDAEKQFINPMFIVGEDIGDDKEVFIVDVPNEGKKKIIVTDGTAGHMDYSYDFTEMECRLKSRAKKYGVDGGFVHFTQNYPEGEMIDFLDEKGSLVKSMGGYIDYFKKELCLCEHGKTYEKSI